MHITVLVDASGSMSVLGKETICESMIQTLTLLPKLNSAYEDCTFDFHNWDKNPDEMIGTKEKYLVLTDGFDLVSIENCNVAVVLIGEDAPKVSKVNYFKAIDILNAVDFLRDNND
ncbi:hypothetical protein [Treponema sp.]|uniref:hypothetical protein n=1 Tax=Treponema sp. TaxID=166 RepID=UPI003FD6EBB7